MCCNRRCAADDSPRGPMTEIKKLLHADTGAETYSYEIEETAGHLTVVQLARAAGGRWKYEVTARRIDPAPGDAQGTADVRAEGGDFATPDEAIIAARGHARDLLAGRNAALGGAAEGPREKGGQGG